MTDHSTSTAEPAITEVSVLVPVSERPWPLDALYEEFSAPLRQAGFRFEFVFIVETAHLGLVSCLEPLVQRDEPIRIVEVSYSEEDTTLLRVGAQRAAYDILVSLPAYPRIEAAELPKVIEPVLEGADMAVARRWPRQDSWLNRLQNKIFHVMVRPVGGQRIRDVACGVRAVRRAVLDALPLYGGFHRFIPLLALRAGYKVREIDTAQHHGDWQPRVYSPGIYLRRVLDILGLFFLIRFTDRPLRFFGLIGCAAFGAGGVTLVILLLQRMGGQPLGDRPILVLAVLLVVLGAQAIALGLVGEIIVHVSAPWRRSYRLLDERDGKEESTPDSRHGESVPS